MISCYITHTSISAIYKRYSHRSENKNKKKFLKTFLKKMKEDVGTSKPKKQANKVERLTYDTKLNKELPYKPT